MLRAIVATVAKRKLLFASAAAYYCTPIRGDERRNKSQRRKNLVNSLSLSYCHGTRPSQKRNFRHSALIQFSQRRIFHRLNSGDTVYREITRAP